MKKIGIDAVQVALPRLVLPMSDLAALRGIDADKLTLGLGLEAMAVCDADEDTATLAAEAAWRLFRDQNLDPAAVGRIYLGTESAVDAAKPTASYVLGVLEARLEPQYGPRSLRRCDVVDLTFACIGGVDALQNSLDWVAQGTGRQAVVLAADVAKYDANSPGEYTQGAAAVALSICENPRILALEPHWGVSVDSVGDFFKPRRTYAKTTLLQEAARLLGQELNPADAQALLDSQKPGTSFWDAPEAEVEHYREAPIFDGPFSNSCYVARVREAVQHATEQSGHAPLNDWNHLVFHLPYAFQGRRMWPEIALELYSAAGRLSELEAAVGTPLAETTPEAFAKSWSKTPHYKALVAAKIAPAERASQRVGNGYTASIFLALVSLLEDARANTRALDGQRVALLAYGSGSKSKVATGTVQPEWLEGLRGVALWDRMDRRVRIDAAQYEALHSKRQHTPLTSPADNDGVRWLGNRTEPLLAGYRRYV